MRNVKHGIIPPSGFRISSSPFRIPSVNASRLLAAGLYLQKTFAYSHEDKLCDSIGVVACGVAVLLPGARLYQLRLSARSSLKDDLGNEYGSGSLMMVSGRYNLPLSVRHDDKGRLVAWSATVNAAYGVFHNKGQARELNPDNLLNASLNISHIRPLSDKWSIIASVGGGVYASLDGVSMKTLLANGAIIFVYKLRKNLDLGIGAGLTNSYGIPMILPMMYFSWRNAGRYELKVDMSSGMKVSVATWLNKKLKLELTALDMDGMSAVMEVDGKSKIYSTVMLRSYISPSYQ